MSEKVPSTLTNADMDLRQSMVVLNDAAIEHNRLGLAGSVRENLGTLTGGDIEYAGKGFRRITANREKSIRVKVGSVGRETHEVQLVYDQPVDPIADTTAIRVGDPTVITDGSPVSSIKSALWADKSDQLRGTLYTDSPGGLDDLRVQRVGAEGQGAVYEGKITGERSKRVKRILIGRAARMLAEKNASNTTNNTDTEAA